MSNPPEGQPSTESYKRETKSNIPPVVGPPTNAIPETAPAKPQHYNSHKRRQWTNDKGMFWVTFAGVVAVVIYTSVAAWQAYLTRRTLDEMREEHVAFVTATDLVMKKADKGGFSIVLQFANSGDTPTRNFEWWMYWRCHHQLNQTVPATPACNDLKVSNGLIGPRSSITDFQSGIMTDDVKKLKKNNNRFEISGWLSYYDVMNRRHRTFFCYKVYFISDDELGKLTCFDTPPCADKECDQHPNYERRMAEEWARALKPIPPEFLPLSPDE